MTSKVDLGNRKIKQNFGERNKFCEGSEEGKPLLKKEERADRCKIHMRIIELAENHLENQDVTDKGERRDTILKSEFD